MMSPLKVYKASAGSGKTHTLTLDYLRLLFRFPGIHRHILAVTFTNKAAGEMKNRILQRLHAISRLDLSDVTVEVSELMSLTGLDQKGVHLRAGELLNTILNDYSSFHVETIDKFFQSVIRSFTRDIGIQPGYNLEMDLTRILTLIVDHLFQDISDNEELQDWLIRFAEERIEESRSWNIKKDIVELGNQLFKEAFQILFVEQDLSILSRKNLDFYLSDLIEIEKTSQNEIRRIGMEALGQIAGNDLDLAEFKGSNSAVTTLFRDASTNSDLNFTPSRIAAIGEEGRWLNKNASGVMRELTQDVLMPLLGDLYQQNTIINTIGIIRKNLFNLGILGDIAARVGVYCREQNIFLISDTSRFLRGIISGNQVPFVYERIGSRYDHLMLDEFQDTSVFQYENFKPLLDNSLASGFENLVVGDVKQSIYRWRNSDWKMLSGELETDFQHQKVTVKSLELNYRSRQEIIRFNNSIFQLIPNIVAEHIRKELVESGMVDEYTTEWISLFRHSYRDAVQQIPENRENDGGLVHIQLLEESDETSFREQSLQHIPLWIEELQKSGIRQGEIAILVRTKREGISVANRLLAYARDHKQEMSFNLISNESLLLAGNISVFLILTVLRYFINPEDELNLSELKYASFVVADMDPSRLKHLFEREVPDDYLPESFIEQVPLLKQLPLFELIETLIPLFRLENRAQDVPYLQALQDVVIDMQRTETVTILHFLQYWERTGFKETISVSEELNAIRILTIHKAKGLEFKGVIVPFCDWEVTTDSRKANVLWCETAGSPFSRIPTIPVRYSDQMKHTMFANPYYDEKMKGFMDSLNLLYVAFTRAIDGLYVGVPAAENKKLKSISDLLNASFALNPEKEPALNNWRDLWKGLSFRSGDLPQYNIQAPDDDQWQFISYPVISRSRTIKVRLRSDAYFLDEDGVFNNKRSYGNMMHMVFSRIYTISDLEPALLALQKEGLILKSERSELQAVLTEKISGPEVKSWFEWDNSKVVYNERSILCGDGTILRPDRLIIKDNRVTIVDFKFGELDKPGYILQVQKYMHQMYNLGYTEVEGFLWYVNLGKTVKVEMS